MPAAGVFKKEIDLSLFTEISSELVLGIVSPFQKGPVNTRTFISNGGDLESTFGKPIDNDVTGQGFFAAREYFRNGNQAFVVRAESATNPAVAPQAALQGVSDFVVATNTDGATSIPATRTLTSAGSNFVTAGVVVGDTLQVETGTDSGFYRIVTVAATVLTIDRDWPVGSNSGETFSVHSSLEFSAADGATGLAASRQFTSATATFQTNLVQAGDVLEIVDVSTPGDNGFYVIAAVTGETTLLLNRDFPTGSLTALTYNVFGGNHPDGADGDTSTNGVFVSAGAQFQLHGVQAGDILVIDDTVDTGNNGNFLITGLQSGSEDTTLEVNVGTWPGGALTNLDFRVLPGSVTLPGESPGEWGNGFTVRTLASGSDPNTKFDLQVRDQGGFVVETVFALDLTNVVAEMAANSVFFPTVTVPTGRRGPAIEFLNTLNGGENGTTGLTDADLIGSTTTGLQLFKNIEEVVVDVLLIPGYSQSQAVGDALVNMAEQTRGDCMAIIDPPDFPTVNSVQDVIDWHNGQGGFGRTTSLNSSHAATYWTWQEIFDPFNNVDRFTAPSGHAVSVWAQSDNAAERWFAPAGLRRGKVTGSQDVRESPDQGERTALQVGANVNPIVNFVQEGIHVFGQKTLLRTTSALNRLNVRRMLLFAERAILDASKTLVFEPNDPTLDREFIALVTPLLEFIQSARGLTEFLVQSATTDLDRANNRAVFQIFIKPTTTAEVIEIQFILTAQTASFQELAA
ncbi:MAG: hypothetical protein MJA83_03415 [Gammaproteobacteria bacterium]|nr:hypothetical protein [Gammaproteobacteria bacterium]